MRITADAAQKAFAGIAVSEDGCRVGVDIVQISDIAESIDRFGERYLNRLFTAHERDCCQGSPAVVAAGLAARFAAKEATVKVLRPSGPQPDWSSMEVVRAPNGACDLVLHAEAARMAAEAGLHSLAVSLSHEGDLAVAMVIALTHNPADRTTSAAN